MKKLINSLMLIVALAFITVSCNVNDDDVLSFDNETKIGQNVPNTTAQQNVRINAAGETAGQLGYTSDATLNAYSANPAVTIENNLGSFNYKVSAISPAKKTIDGKEQSVRLTRDIEVFLKPVQRTKIAGYGYYTYPIHLRQVGDYTQYMSADKLKAYSDAINLSDQCYAKGKVVSVSGIEMDTYPITKYPVNPQFFYDRDAMPAYSDAECAANLGEKYVTVTLNIDGENIKFLVNDLARDNFLDTFASSLKVGSTVEVSLLRASYNSDFGGIINVNPLAFFEI